MPNQVDLLAEIAFFHHQINQFGVLVRKTTITREVQAHIALEVLTIQVVEEALDRVATK